MPSHQTRLMLPCGVCLSVRPFGTLVIHFKMAADINEIFSLSGSLIVVLCVQITLRNSKGNTPSKPAEQGGGWFSAVNMHFLTRVA